MPTMLELCQGVARRVGVEVPTSIIGNADDTAQRLRGAADAAGRALLRRDWRCLTFEGTINLAAGTLDYALPTAPAFHHFKPPADVYDRTLYRPASGPSSSSTFQRDKAAIGSLAGLDPLFAVRADVATRAPRLYLSRDLGRTGVLGFDYVTREWVDVGGGGFSDSWQADGNTALFDEYLLDLCIEWRFRKAIGRAYAQELNEAEAVERRLYAQENLEILHLGAAEYELGAVNVSDGNWPG